MIISTSSAKRHFLAMTRLLNFRQFRETSMRVPWSFFMQDGAGGLRPEADNWTCLRNLMQRNWFPLSNGSLTSIGMTLATSAQRS